MHFLKASGTPEEIGNQHGEEFRREIRELSDIRMELVRSYFDKSSLSKIEELVYAHLDQLKAMPDLFQEFYAIAEAADISLGELYILNNYTDLRDFGSAGKKDEGCSCIAVKNTNGTISAQTWDMHASAYPYMLHLTVTQPVKMEILTVTGCVGLAGVSENNVSVMINNMHCKEVANGAMWPALVRKMLEQKSAKEAKEYLEKHLPSSGHNYVLTDGNEAYDVEATGKRSNTVSELTSDGVFFHTNHYVGPLKETENLDRQSPSTHLRYEVLEKYFSSKNPDEISTKSISKDLFTEGQECSVCIPEPKGPGGSMTCGGLLLDHKNRSGEFFAGLYGMGKVQKISW